MNSPSEADSVGINHVRRISETKNNYESPYDFSKKANIFRSDVSKSSAIFRTEKHFLPDFKLLLLF